MNTLSDGHRKPLFPRGPGLGLKALALLAVCGVLMAADMDGERLKGPREWMSWVLQPVVWVAQIPTKLASIVEHFDSRERLIDENRGLRLAQIKLASQMQRYAALEAENRRIRDILHASARLTDASALADIIAANQDPYRQQVTLNKGAKDGVYRGQAVVDAWGVLGQVVQVNPTTSVALLLTDPDHGIPVEITRSGLQTIALGQGSDQPLRMPFLPANADVQKGDLVVSSSLGGRFPAGYPVGRIDSIDHTPGGHFKEAFASAAAHVGGGRQVLLVWSERQPIDQTAAKEAEALEAAELKAPPKQGTPRAQ